LIELTNKPILGLLSDKYLGAPEPVSKKDLNTWYLLSRAFLEHETNRKDDCRSLGKYKKFIDRWGNWALFQELLKTLKQVGDKHSVSIANVAVKYILAKPQVSSFHYFNFTIPHEPHQFFSCRSLE